MLWIPRIRLTGLLKFNITNSEGCEGYCIGHNDMEFAQQLFQFMCSIILLAFI